MTVTLGVPKEKPEVTAHYGLFLTGRTLKGSLFGGWKPKSDLPSLVEKYMKKVSCAIETPVVLIYQVLPFWHFKICLKMTRVSRGCIPGEVRIIRM